MSPSSHDEVVRASRDEDLRAFYARTIRTGESLSLAFATVFAIYIAASWGEPHRGIMAVIAAMAIVGTAIMWMLPLLDLLRGHYGVFFGAWSISLVVVVCVCAGLDGGATSPIILGLFMPIAFAGNAYPPRPAIATSVLAVIGYLIVASLTPDISGAEMLFTACGLFVFAALGVSQSISAAQDRAQLRRASRTDALTGCANRRGFEERMQEELILAREEGGAVGVILIDLDDFKQINDVHGHAAGDELLCWIVRRLEGELQDHEAVGRLGGDEFAILVGGIRHEQVRRRADELRAILAERTQASFGVATFPEDAQTYEDLLHAADVAMYEVKRARDNRPRELGWAAALAQAVDLRMSGGHDHSAAVGDLAARIAAQLGWPAEDVEDVRLAATLHDVGKAAVPDAILRKPGRLDHEELRIVRSHPPIGADMVGRIPGMERIAQWIRCSHERPDGHGYPLGLRGPEIPEAARIIHVADAFDAMTSDLPYREALSVSRAMDELQRCAGSQFDPDCVQALGEVVAADESSAVAA
ncbi:MAG: diguanylate cyclase [Solirubrobacteraceae bacterium]|nr:diguanylate cyclase [Solirubrobacteraceae bacterium]